MLPAQHKLTRSSEFRMTMRRGVKYGHALCAVHVLVWNDDDQTVPVRFGGPRFGLIVSKAVGNAVVRHRVARRLRHICAENSAAFPPSSTVVIRAFPALVDASHEQLSSVILAAAAKAEKKGRRA